MSKFKIRIHYKSLFNVRDLISIAGYMMSVQIEQMDFLTAKKITFFNTDTAKLTRIPCRCINTIDKYLIKPLYYCLASREEIPHQEVSVPVLPGYIWIWSVDLTLWDCFFERKAVQRGKKLWQSLSLNACVCTLVIWGHLNTLSWLLLALKSNHFFLFLF